MDVVPCRNSHLIEMAALFAARLHNLRAELPLVPDTLEQRERVLSRLSNLVGSGPAWVALEAGQVIGYLGGFIIPDFRGAGRTAAYCPEWGHAACSGSESLVYRALYAAAAGAWRDLGCDAHALTLLARQPETEQVWFWNGFGALVVDAVRGLQPIPVARPPDSFTLRRALSADLNLLLALEAEHAHHYAAPPVLMSAYKAVSPDEMTAVLESPDQSVWLALRGEEPTAFVRFSSEHGGADVLAGPGGVAIIGAYTRPAYRGQRVMPALLNAALAEYAQLGVQRCTVDFESINPEAAVFWPRWFQLVCLSVLRIPETAGTAAQAG